MSSRNAKIIVVVVVLQLGMLGLVAWGICKSVMV